MGRSIQRSYTGEAGDGGSPTADPYAGNGLADWRGAIIALVGGLALVWPILVTQSIWVFADTGSYLRGGEIIWGMILEKIMSALDPTMIEAAGTGTSSGIGGGIMATNTHDNPDNLRSIVYSMSSYAAYRVGGTMFISYLQAVLLIFMLIALIPNSPPKSWGALGAGVIYLVFLTGMAWYASFLMPDIFSAMIVAYGAVLLTRFPRLAMPQKIVLTSIATFAVAAHYGNPLLAAAFYGSIFVLLFVQKRLTLALVVGSILPVFFSPLLNIAASSIALEKTSIAPLRLPILLARSLQDGPALRYLKDECPEAEYAFCDLFPDLVNLENMNANRFLFGKNGYNGLSNEMAARIRAEEIDIVLRATLRYPGSQIRRTLCNIGITLTHSGIGDLNPAIKLADAPKPVVVGWEGESPRAWLVLREVVPWATWLGVLPFLVLLLQGRLDPPTRAIGAAIVLGLLLNAIIFGGLSAPGERYAGRVVWLLPFLSVLALAWNQGRGRIGAEEKQDGS